VPGTIVETVDEGQASTQSTQEDESGKHDAVHNRENTSVPGLVNVAYFIDNKGDILSRYVKVNLWSSSERPYLASAGRAPHVAFDTPLGRMGLLICWDLGEYVLRLYGSHLYLPHRIAFPEAWRELIADGAKIICLPTFWTLSNPNDAGLKWNVDAERVFVDTTVTARACENTCAVIMANAGGPPNKPSKLYQGDSCVTVPFLGPISKLAGPAEGMIIANLDMQIVEDAEKDYQIRADLARADWHYDYRHTSDEFAVKQSRPKL